MSIKKVGGITFIAIGRFRFSYCRKRPAPETREDREIRVAVASRCLDPIQPDWAI